MSGPENTRYIVQVFVGDLSDHYEALSVEAGKQTTSEEIVLCIVDRLSLTDPSGAGAYELAEVVGDSTVGQECKERRLGSSECPVALMMLWPQVKHSCHEFYRFYLREKLSDVLWPEGFAMDPQLIRDYFYRFLYQPKDREYPDLCQLPELDERTLLDNLKDRFNAGHIYTYVGSILIAVNPFKFHPIYNPKYVKLYQNRRLGPDLPPHIFAVADAAYHCMLKDRRNQCVVISGESGSGKTESTNFLLHHLTALSQKGSHGSGVEQTILSAGPVLEAFGNAKTAHNNNSSRFGKFIQVNYKENGMVHGAVVQKYLLEKSRICSHGRNERNYHVFYYLLAGASDSERQLLHLLKPTEYNYLSRSASLSPETAIDERHEFSRLKQSMEMVGFTAEKQRRLFSVLSSVLLLGNVEFQPRKSAAYHHDEAVAVKNPQVVALISELLRVKQETLLQALTAKRARASGETLVINYRLPEAIAARDAMAKCLYGALFDWIVLQVNHALLSKKDSLREHQGNSIGVLDIFGFEDFGLCNSFEQFCINYANEHLQYYFNQHVFRYEQEEYRKEGIRWTDIEFMDNTGCLHLIEGKPSGLLCMLDDQCNFPGATNETLLQKFNSVHKDNSFYEIPQRRENAFIVRHYAGKVKYQVHEFREKNLDLMRQDIVGVLKNSSMAFVRELVGADPVAVFRWAIVRAFFRGYFAFHEAGRKHRLGRDGTKTSALQTRFRNHIPNESLISPGKVRIYYKQRSVNETPSSPTTNHNNEPSGRSSRLSWPQITNSETSTNIPGSRYKSTKSDYLQAPSPPNRVALDPDEARVLERANQIVMKNKSFRPRERAKKGLKNLQTVKTLAGRTQSLGLPLGNKARKQPLTVTAQFQHSLHSLMDTLGHADPFFIRCIKSNAHKIPNEFDEETVQRQLRYTGMLETVRIRQAGYNVRLTYDEFIQMYRILLPRGLISSQVDVRNFLLTLNLNRDHYQLGATKIFLRESEKEKLDVRLHQQIMSSIVTLQRWTRTFLEHRRYQRWRAAASKIQIWWRLILVQKTKQRSQAVVRIQTWWRCHHQRKFFLRFREAFINFQAHARGTLLRRKISEVRAARARAAETTSTMSTDEAFQSKESSQEELDQRTGRAIQAPPRPTSSRPSRSELHDSDDDEYFLTRTRYDPEPTQLEVNSSDSSKSSGIQEDSDIEFRIEEIPESSRGVIINRSRRLHPSVSTMGNFIDVSCLGGLSERKGSSDSLTSQRSIELQQRPGGPGGFAVPVGLGGPSTSGSGDGAPVRDTLNKAKRQFQAFIGMSSGKRDKGIDPHTAASLAAVAAATLPQTISTHSDSENEDIIQSSPITPSPKPPLTRSYPVKTKVFEHEGEPEAPVRIARRVRASSREHCRSLASEESLSNVDGSGSNLATIREAAWVSRSTDNASEAGAASLHVHDITKKRSRSGGITTLELKRRNSDPAATKSLAGLNLSSLSITTDLPVSVVSEALQWKGTTTFTIAGHSFRKVNKFSKDDQCASCNKLMDSLVTQGHKCSDCKQLFHTKCIQNGGVLHRPCQHSGSYASGAGPSHGNISPIASTSGLGGARRKHRKHSRAPHDMNKQPATGKFSLTGTSEFTDSTDKIISDATELEMMQDFITKKIYKMEEGNKKPSEVDRVFKQALREFKDNLVSTYSVMNKQGTSLNIKYKDLIANFLYVMETVCNQEKCGENFPVTMGVNAFRGFMNEFMNLTRLEEKPTKTKRKKEKKRKLEDPIHHGGHLFVLTIINIPTACEMCSSFFMWPIERGLVCQNCKLTCHKKCYSKVRVACPLEGGNGPSSSQNVEGGSRIFGVPLHQLASGDGKIPLVVDRLITTIEIYGLYTEGIYRKSGVSSKVKELKARLEEIGCDAVNFGDYQVHVLAAVFKSFLREMPEPLLTYDAYEDFLRAGNLSDPKDRITTIFAILKKLPKPNFDLMERLIFHLARVALHEDANRMNSSALAIVFAPCVLRTNKPVPAQDSLLDISRQTQCIETIVAEQLRKVRSTLADIDTLDTACHTATHRLSSLRSSKIFSPEELLPAAEKAGSAEAEDEEEVLLLGHIQEIQKEKALLTSTLPSLTRTTSDDDLLSTDDGSLDDVTGRADEESQARRARRSVVSRSVSGGDDELMISNAGRNPANLEEPFALRNVASGSSVSSTYSKSKLNRQSSSDNSVVSIYPPIETDCDEDPIMV